MIECLDFRSYQKGSLLGFANFRLIKSGIEIFGCGVYQKDGHRWVNLPSREYKNEVGETKYMPIVRFVNKDHYTKFGELAIAAIDKWCAENSQKTEQSCTQQQNSQTTEEVPF